MCCRDQFVQDTAITRRVTRTALPAQHRELPLQRPHALESRPHPQQVFVNQAINVAAVRVGVFNEIEQALNVRQRDVERTAMANEGQPLQMRWAVGPIAILLTGWGWQEAGLLVVTNRLDIDACRLSQLANPHRPFQERVQFGQGGCKLRRSTGSATK